MLTSRVRIDQRNNPLRIVMVLLSLLLIIVLLYNFLILPSLRDDIYDEKMLHTKEMIDVGLSVLQRYHSLEQQQVLNREEAQTDAADMIRSIQFGQAGLDYYWLTDFDANVIVHPFRPDLEGQGVNDYRDPEGFYLFQEFIRISEEQGSGHVTYSWQYYDLDHRYEKKLSYVAAFEPWGWIIGTGVYLVDIEAVIAQRRNNSFIWAAVLFAVTASLAFFYYKNKLKEHELLESEEKYRLIAENTSDVISILDLNLRYLYISPAIYKMKGLTPEEAVSRNLEETLAPDSLQKMIKKYCQQIDLEKQNKGHIGLSYQLELEEYCKDGSLIWTENSFSFIRDSGGQPIGLITISRDITGRRRQQEILEKERREKSIILENLSEIVSYKDLEMNIIWANPAARRRYRLSPEEYTGQKCYKMWYGADQICDNCQVIKALQEGKVCRGEVNTPDGDCWLETASPIFDDGGNVIGVLGTSLDITSLKLVEKKLKLLNEELEQRVNDRTAELELANKELSAFTYSVSHDLRAPLRSIRGFSEAILEDHSSGLDSEGRNYLDRVIAASYRMSELIDDLLKLSRVARQEINFDRVDISSLVKARFSYLQTEEPGRVVDCRITSSRPANGDAALLRIALDNLIDNAWKFTGTVEPACIEFGSNVNNGRTVYYVSDNGTGFDPGYTAKIFKPFQRLHSHEQYPGTGIGLSIVQRIFERHGGEIWAEAEPGKGAVFYFTLPD